MGEFPNRKTQFSSTYQPNNPGRKKKIYTVLKKKGYSADDIRTAVGEIAFYTQDEIEKVKDNPDLPIIVRIIATLFDKALKKTDWASAKDLIEHVIGKANQQVALETNPKFKMKLSEVSSLADFTDEELAEMEKLAYKKMAEEGNIIP